MPMGQFPDQKPQPSFTFGTNLNRAARLWRTVFRSLAQLEARPTPYISVLSYLITGSEGATQKELATLMGADAPTVVRVLDALEGQGLVERRVKEGDRRSKTVHFTETGKDFAEAFKAAGFATSDRLLEGCDPQDINAAIRVFRRISENAELLSSRRQPVV
jgi:MarR family transcriptional regulator for hemolysin